MVTGRYMETWQRKKQRKFYREQMQMEVVKQIIQVRFIELTCLIEWVVATIDKENLLSGDKLKTAFRLFDKDDSGTISSSEVKDLLCQG